MKRNLLLLGLFALMAIFVTPQKAFAQTDTLLFENFEGVTHAFTIVNGSQSNKWHVGTAVANSGSKSAYISNDSGVSNTYYTNYSSKVHMYKNVVFPASTTPHELKFNWRAQGEKSYDFLRISLIKVTTTPTAGSSLAEQNQIGTDYCMGGATTWNDVVITIPANVTDTTMRLVFTWHNDGSQGTQPPAALDNIVLVTIPPLAKSVACTAGQLKNLLTSAERNATDLTITGTIDARDVAFMRDSMPYLSTLNMGSASIVAYSGTGGTISSSSSYPANTMPANSFYTTSRSKTSLTTVTLPTNLTGIGNNAFHGCTGLSGNLILPIGITSIGTYAFNGCSGLSGSFTLPTGLTSISAYAFYGCRGLSGSLTLPTGITSIGAYAFYGCSGFTGNLILPIGITSIGNYAFRGCSGFKGTLTLPAELTKISDYAFYGCSGLSGNLTLPTGITSIGSYAFYDCSGFTGNLTFTENVTSIGSNAFRGCSGFKGTLTLPTGITSISESAFYGCSGLSGNLILPTGITSIGSNAFRGCSSFTGNLTLPAGLTKISESAFYGCKGFTGNLSLPIGITSIGDDAFRACSGFTGNLILPENLTSIGEYAFYGCSGFDGGLSLPAKLTSIGSYAFRECSNLTGNLILPENLTSIGNYAFYGCSGLNGNLSLPIGVTGILSNTFYGCSGFTRLSLHAGIVSIDDNAFSGCSGLEEIVNVNLQPITINANVFADVKKDSCELKVRNGALDAYQTADVWKDFSNIIGSGVGFDVRSTSFGSVNSSIKPDSIYPIGTQVTFTAIPLSSRGTFASWRDRSGVLISTTNPLVISLTQDTMLIAEFTPPLSTVLIFEDFENATHSLDSIVNGTQKNKWHVGMATANGSSKSIYISNDSGVSNAYSTDNSSTVHFYRSITLPSSTPHLLTFDWKIEGEGSYDYLQVFLVRSNTIPVAGTELTTNRIGDTRYHLGGADTWNTASITIPAFATDTTVRLVFSWRNDGSQGKQPPAAIDNIVIWKSFDVDVNAADTTLGTVAGVGKYPYGDSATVTASPKDGYRLGSWTVNGVVVSRANPYTFEVKQGTTLTANFVEDIDFAIAHSANPSHAGTVSGGGNHSNEMEITVTATPNTGFVFTNWTENGTVVSTKANYTFVVTEDRVLVANFDVYTSVVTDNAPEVKIYPNPSNGLVNVEVAEKSTVRIYDMLGKQIATYDVEAHSEISLGRASGIYFIHVESNGKTATHKVIVQ